MSWNNEITKEAAKLTCDFPDYEKDKFPAIDFPVFALNFQ